MAAPRALQSTSNRSADLATTTLDVTGMTCASCAARIEKKLNRLDGVQASVNYALGTAAVQHDGDHTAQEFIEVVEGLGYGASAPQQEHVGSSDDSDQGSTTAHEERSWRDRFVISAALSVPVVLLSMIPPLQFTHWQWAALVLASPVAVWGAWPFHRAAVLNLRHGTTTMDTLISLGVTAAYLWSVWALFLGDAGMPGMTMSFTWVTAPGESMDEIYLEVAAGVTTFIVAGRWFEIRAKARAGSALRTLLASGAKDVALLRDGVETRVPVDQLAVGDTFVARPGERLAADGVVTEGGSGIDTSMLTGESVPLEVGVGDVVAGGTVVVDGRVVVQATRVGEATALARMAELVRRAQDGKAPVQRLADRVSAVFVPVVVLLALATLATWWLVSGDVSQAFTAAVAVLIVACPCALGLATPTALLVGTGRAAQFGIVVKGAEVLESTRRVDTIVLDKTGTITDGRMRVVDTHAMDGDDTGLLRLAAAVERGSEHPVGRAIVAAAGPTDEHELESFAAHRGSGVEAIVDGRAVRVGRPEWCAPNGWNGAARELLQTWSLNGRTVVGVADNGAAYGLIAVADTPRPTSQAAIARLRSLGLEPLLLTGDDARVARNVASQVGLDDDAVLAEVMPQDKFATIEDLQRQGRVVAMVGDGVNDAAALVQADLGIAMGTGADVAIEASDLTLVRADLNAAADAIEMSRATLRTIKTNLFWAFAYNVAALPLAALGYLNPLIAGAAMALSSVFVVSNSLRLRRFTP